jgi:hypothetical protein
MMEREEDTGEDQMEVAERREAVVGEEWDHCGMSYQLAVRVVRKEEH